MAGYRDELERLGFSGEEKAELARRLAAEGAAGLLLPVIPKGELFAQVRLHGALPRKAFSMGAARDKRYYLECRRIRP